MSARLNLPLGQLKRALDAAMQPPAHAAEWGNPKAMTRVLAEVTRAFDTKEVKVDDRSVARSLEKFRQEGDVGNFIELKYVCFGLNQSIGKQQWRLIDDPKLFDRLVNRVDKETEKPRRFRKCYQGLVHSYFDYPVYQPTSETGAKNWKKLRSFLSGRMDVALHPTNTPAWLNTLVAHSNLLQAEPCARYARALMEGSTQQLADATAGIGISPNSWVWEEAVLAHVKAVTDMGDEPFKKALNSVLAMVESEKKVKLSAAMKIRCLAALLVRYTRVKNRIEHAKLRDLSIAHIGNPWLKRAAWDAHVQNEDARRMVDGWLKHRLITDFFEVLSDDGSTDRRRLTFWLQFAPVIEDMWFVLGRDAQTNSSEAYKELRRRMEGRLQFLNDSTATNNAFIMQMNGFHIVEFGEKGNACYVFQSNNTPYDLSKRYVSVHRIKDKARAVRHLPHLPTHSWATSRFIPEICPLIDWWPEGTRSVQRGAFTPPPSKARIVPPPPQSSLETQPTRKGRAPSIASVNPERLDASTVDAMVRILGTYGVEHDDRRDKGGSFWILTHDKDPTVTRILLGWKFNYAAGKGWYRG